MRGTRHENFRATLPSHRESNRFGDHARITAEVSGVSCRLCDDGNRNQYFGCGGYDYASVPRCRMRQLARSSWETIHSQPEGQSMNHINAIALNLMSLALGSLRGLSLGDVALIIAWTLIMIVYVAGQAWRFPGKRRPKS